MARLPDNVEKSFYQPDAYVIYDGEGHVWHARRRGKLWGAKAAANNPCRALGAERCAASLTALASELAARRRPRAITPF